MLTYGECVRTLACFLWPENPPPDLPHETVEHLKSLPPLERVQALRDWTRDQPTPTERALMKRIRSLPPSDAAHAFRESTLTQSHDRLEHLVWQLAVAGDFPHADDPISESLWRSPVNEKDPERPLWDIDDTLRAAALCAFALPEVGVFASAGIGALEGILTKVAQRDEHQSTSEVTSALTRLDMDLKVSISNAVADGPVRDLVGRIDELESRLHETLLDRTSTFGAVHGLSPSWVDRNMTKASALDPSWLGLVWDIINTDPFTTFVNEPTPIIGTLEYGLVDPPESLSMCTVLIYCRAIQVVVNALILYSLICLMPPEALRPGWDPKTFRLTDAVRSAAWTRRPRGVAHSAFDCWEHLRMKLDPTSPTSWLKWVDPATGDARRAFELIKGRLDRISLEVGVTGPRGDRWYLPEDRRISHEILHGEVRDDGSYSGANDVFRGCCAGPRDEVVDSALGLGLGLDTFARSYQSFRRTLTIHWWMPGDSANVIADVFSFGVKAAAEAIMLGSLAKNYGSYVSPWSSAEGTADPGTYDQVCWAAAEAGLGDSPLGPASMESPIVRAAIAWMGFVLDRYARKLSYSLYPGRHQSTLTIANTFHAGWAAIFELAGTFLGEGATEVDRDGTDASSRHPRKRTPVRAR